MDINTEEFKDEVFIESALEMYGEGDIASREKAINKTKQVETGEMLIAKKIRSATPVDTAKILMGQMKKIIEQADKADEMEKILYYLKQEILGAKSQPAPNPNTSTGMSGKEQVDKIDKTRQEVMNR